MLWQRRSLSFVKSQPRSIDQCPLVTEGIAKSTAGFRRLATPGTPIAANLEVVVRDVNARGPDSTVSAISWGHEIPVWEDISNLSLTAINVGR